MNGLVARILDSSFIDGPGHRAVVFMQGCDMRCAYCHNPETRGTCDACGLCLPACPVGALSRTSQGAVAWDEATCVGCDTCIRVCPKDADPRVLSLSPEALAARLSPLEPFLDGVTFSGGECSLQAPFLLEVAPCIRALRSDLTVYADTNGAASAATFDALLEGLDGFILDLKAWDPRVHASLTGLGPERVRRNTEAAARAGKLVEVRTVLVAGVNDDLGSLEASAAWLLGLGEFPWRLIPFRPQGVRGPYADRPAYDLEAFQAILARLRARLGDRVLGPAALA